jgi:predicted dehydrogenase
MGISIGMVGLGAFGSGFVDLFKAHPLVDRIAFCDKEPDRVRKWADDAFMQEKFCQRDGFSSVDDICRSDIDALVIMTQPWLHGPQCLQAMNAGKHVFSAVPILWSPDGDEILDWSDRIIATVKSSGRRFMLGETSYYHPEVMFLRRKAAEGAFGYFISAESEYSHDNSGAFGCSLRKVAAHRTATSSGAQWPTILREKYLKRGIFAGPMHYPTHSVSGSVSIMKAHAVKVSAVGTRPTGYDEYFPKTGQSLSNETAFFHLSNGAVLTAREHREIAGEGYEMSIYGSCGTWRNGKWHWVKREHNTPLDYVPDHGVETVPTEEQRDVLPRAVQKAFMLAEDHSLTAEKIENADFTPKGHFGSHPYLVHEFVSAVAEDRMPAINAWEAARYLAMGVMAHKSALKGGELLDVPDWGDAPSD